MSTRERWVVYPLLFLALGIALRDKVVPPSQLHCNELVCNQMATNLVQCKTLFVTGPNGQPVVAAGTDNKSRAGILETFTTDGVRQIRLLSSNVGGMISMLERDGKLALIFGDTGEHFGIFAELPSLGQLIPLTLPWRVETKPAEPKLPQKALPKTPAALTKPEK